MGWYAGLVVGIRWPASGVFDYSAVLARDSEKTQTMRVTNTVFIVAFLSSPFMICAAQAPSAETEATPAAMTSATPSGGPPAAAPPAVAAPLVPSPSSLLQPSLDTVQKTLAGLNTARWKRGSVRDEASADIDSILRDMQAHMVPLLKESDAAPGTLSKSLPVLRHVDALYDVLLRVVEAARMAAPDDQANALRLALKDLGNARLALDDSMEIAAGVQEKQLVDLRVTVQKQAAFKCPAAPPAPACPQTPAKKPVKRKPKPPATTTPGTTPQKPATPANGTAPKTGP
ncbi:MAG: hypothetical protein ACLPH3_03570 [Terracidiphilus sp.]